MNGSIKIILENIIDPTVQKLLSWSGKGTNKPSIIKKYKEIFDALKEVVSQTYKDYNFDKLKQKVSTLLRNA